VLRYRPEMARPRRRPFVSPLVSAASFAVLAAALAGCFTTAADFRNDAETFIEENEELREALFPGSDVGFDTATCVEPENQDEGTTFPCSAIDSAGETWEFEIVITGSSEYEVNVARRPADS
jgi:hypothetical protein